jgi:GR25 family glycosyltransferase involved in LPS biosynthesis
MSTLLDYPTFLINLDRCPERLQSATSALTDAGFTQINRCRAVDAFNDDLNQAWAVHGSPRKDPSDPEFSIYLGRQGCALSHFKIWKHIIDNNIPVANVFEDDIMFHPEWATLHPIFFEETPKDFDIIYMGSKHETYDEPGTRPKHIQTSPVYCTHAYTITLAGATKLYNLLIKDPRGVSTIDNHIRRYMVYFNSFRSSNPNIKLHVTWYAWNATTYPCTQADMEGDFKWRNMGLVFQDVSFPSVIQEHY